MGDKGWIGTQGLIRSPPHRSHPTGFSIFTQASRQHPLRACTPSLPWKGTLMPRPRLSHVHGVFQRALEERGRCMRSGRRLEGHPSSWAHPRSVMGAMIPRMDGRDQGRFGDSPCEDHRGGCRGGGGRCPHPEPSARWWLPPCLPAFVFAAELGGSGAAPPASPTSRPRPRRGRAQAGGQLWGKQ